MGSGSFLGVHDDALRFFSSCVGPIPYDQLLAASHTSDKWIVVMGNSIQRSRRVPSTQESFGGERKLSLALTGVYFFGW